MNAHTYPPAQSFELPAFLPRELSARETSIAELREVQEIWAIVQDVFPYIEAVLASEQIVPHLGNFSLRTLAQFGVLPAAVYDAIEHAIEDGVSAA